MLLAVEQRPCLVLIILSCDMQWLSSCSLTTHIKMNSNDFTTVPSESMANMTNLATL